MTNKLFVAATVAAFFTMPALAHGENGPRIDDHAPIGVMADHYHKKGEWMTSLRWMNMGMNDLANSMMGPQSMSMNMVMAGLMYAPSDKLTLMAMVGYTDKSMDMIMMGSKMDMGVSDFSDAKLGAIVPLYEGDDSRLLVATSVSVPLGKTGAETPMGARMSLNMQPGTGSLGVMPSVTYTKFLEGWSLGAQAKAGLWLDDNSYGEKAGDSFAVTSWVSRTITEAFSVSLRGAYETKGAVSGALTPALTDGRENVSAYVGANLFLGSHRFAVEAGLPLWRDRGKNALAQDYMLTVGWQKAF